MGICKCKKRSEEFCYQHKKFVCEGCVTTDHTVCHIGSYVNWLTDSEFQEEVCGICKGDVTTDNSIRLSCYDIFHPECIDVYASTLPQTTALAGYSCPKCGKVPILPSMDKVDILSNTIRKTFALSMWAEKLLNINKPLSISSPVSPTNQYQQNQQQQQQQQYNYNINGGASALTNNSNTNGNIMNGTSVNGSSHVQHNIQSLLEETPPLSHLNSNPYGIAIRKQPTTGIDSNINSSSGNSKDSDTVIQFDKSMIHHHQDEEEDKYNKKSLYNGVLRFKNDNKTLFYIIVAIGFIILFFMFTRGGGSGDGTQQAATAADNEGVKNE